MDLKKTGAFIKAIRKEKGLTQNELAEKLMVSEKTISKWECGNGFPDTSLMLPLCNALDISANELLSSKRLAEKEYKPEAEKNITNLKQKNDEYAKFIFKLQWIILGFSIALYISLVIFAALSNIPIWVKIIMFVLGFTSAIFGSHICLMIETNVGYFKCKKCGHIHTPSYSNVFFGIHLGRTRYMRCPNCNKKCWHEKITNK